MPEAFTFCGRMFRTGELELMRQTALEFSALPVTEIASCWTGNGPVED